MGYSSTTSTSAQALWVAAMVLGAGLGAVEAQCGAGRCSDESSCAFSCGCRNCRANHYCGSSWDLCSDKEYSCGNRQFSSSGSSSCTSLPSCGQSELADDNVRYHNYYSHVTLTSSQYVDNQDCTWTGTCGSNQIAVLTWANIHTESCCDHVNVDDGSYTLQRVSGTSTPSTVRGSTREMNIRFTSDGSVTSSGFEAHFTCETAACGHGQHLSGGSCHDCSAGQYQGSSNFRGSSCTNCGSGQYSSASYSRCVNCPAGQYQSHSGHSDCSSCPGGQYSSSGHSGWHQPWAVMSVCVSGFFCVCMCACTALPRVHTCCAVLEVCVLR